MLKDFRFTDGGNNEYKIQATVEERDDDTEKFRSGDLVKIKVMQNGVSVGSVIGKCSGQLMTVPGVGIPMRNVTRGVCKLVYQHYYGKNEDNEEKLGDEVRVPKPVMIGPAYVIRYALQSEKIGNENGVLLRLWPEEQVDIRNFDLYYMISRTASKIRDVKYGIPYEDSTPERRRDGTEERQFFIPGVGLDEVRLYAELPSKFQFVEEIK